MNGTASECFICNFRLDQQQVLWHKSQYQKKQQQKTNYIVFSPSSSVGGSAQNLKNTDTVGAGGATGGLEYNANTGNLKGKSFQSSVSAATTIGFVGTSSFSNFSS